MGTLTKHFSFILFFAFLAGLYMQPSNKIEVLAKEPTESEKAAEDLLEKQKSFIDSHIEWAIDLGDEIEAKYGGKPPITAVISEAAYESGWGESDFCQAYNNDFGIGGADNPQWFASHYDSWACYYKLIATRDGYVDNGSLECEYTYDYILALVAGGYCSDEGYLEDVLNIAIKTKPYIIAKEAEIRAEREKSRLETKKREAEKKAAAEKVIEEYTKMDRLFHLNLAQLGGRVFLSNDRK